MEGGRAYRFLPLFNHRPRPPGSWVKAGASITHAKSPGATGCRLSGSNGTLATMPPSSRGLGRGPFKAKTGVRIPLGAPPLIDIQFADKRSQCGVALQHPANPATVPLQADRASTSGGAHDGRIEGTGRDRHRRRPRLRPGDRAEAGVAGRRGDGDVANAVPARRDEGVDRGGRWQGAGDRG